MHIEMRRNATEFYHTRSQISAFQLLRPPRQNGNCNATAGSGHIVIAYMTAGSLFLLHE